MKNLARPESRWSSKPLNCFVFSTNWVFSSYQSAKILWNPKYTGKLMCQSYTITHSTHILHSAQRPHFSTCPVPLSLSAVQFSFEQTGQWLALCFIYYSSADLSPGASVCQREQTVYQAHCSLQYPITAVCGCVHKCRLSYGIVVIDSWCNYL